MAVSLNDALDSSFRTKFYLETYDPNDDACLQAGKDWLHAEKLAALEKTRDGFLVEFRSIDRPWRAEFLPEKLKITEGDALPDLVKSFPGSNNDYAKAYMVSPRLKYLIEGVQTPEDGWQFFPVEILNRDESIYDTYYVWWVHKVVDGIDESSEGVKSVSGPIDGRHRWTYNGTKTPERLKLRKSVVGGLNAWIDFRFQPSAGIFVSDALFKSMLDNKMTGILPNSGWSEV